MQPWSSECSPGARTAALEFGVQPWSSVCSNCWIVVPDNVPDNVPDEVPDDVPEAAPEEVCPLIVGAKTLKNYPGEATHHFEGVGNDSE